jgi:copper chaperone CopZ
MKKLFIVAAVLLTSLFVNAQFQTASLTAAGLTCAMCTKAIYNSLEKIPSIEKVDADIKNSQFLITFKKGASVDPDQLKNAVEDAGFSVSKLTMTGDFNNISINSDTHVQIGGKTFHFINTPEKVLNGRQTVTLVDKSYVTAKEFKKLAGTSHHPCVETGKAEKCCVKMGSSHNERIYHVMI